MPRKITAGTFWSRIVKSDDSECFIWTLSKDNDGYGICNYLGESKAHRVAWKLIYGDIPESFNVLHKCDNPPCCNPYHLFLGTQLDNMRDCKAKGRTVSDPHQKITPVQVIQIRSDYDSGKLSRIALAKAYDLSRTHISRIVLRKSWTHL